MSVPYMSRRLRRPRVPRKPIVLRGEFTPEQAEELIRAYGKSKWPLLLVDKGFEVIT